MTTKIFIITGEESGDRLGADLIRKARESSNFFDIEFQGIGGEMMHEQGMNSIFPLEDIAVMGLTEIIPKFPVIFARLDQTVKAIVKFKPDIVISIDCPDFSLRVQKRLRKDNRFKTRQIHYVAPTVWAWREGRARAVSKYLDKILCLYPFEPQYFQKYGLDADFVGHPVVERHIPQTSEQDFKKRNGLPSSHELVGLYPGSRRGEIKRHAPVFADCMKALKNQGQLKDIHFIIPTFDRFVPELEQHFSEILQDVSFITQESEKQKAMSVLTSALCVNGTIGLELAMAKVPHITVYKTGWLTAFIARHMIHVDHMHLVNILKDHGCLGSSDEQIIVPEFVQEDVRVLFVSVSSVLLPFKFIWV
mgnify:CR=1 FL=1